MLERRPPREGVPGHRRCDPAAQDRHGQGGLRRLLRASAEGETFGLVGESGCGKTTIGRLVVALEQPDGRERPLRRRRPHARSAERSCAQRGATSSSCSRTRTPRSTRGCGSARSCGEPLVVQGIGIARPSSARASPQLLDEVGLSPKAAQLYPHEFSGGQRQRIGLARALTLNPKLIVADEPVSALDVSIQAQILNMMRALQERHGLTYIVISHDLAVVKYLADAIGVMYLGKLVELGPAEEIYAQAAHPYTRGLIDTIPVPDPVAARQRKHAAIHGELPSAINPPSGCRFRTRCPFAQDICAEEEPPLRRFGRGTSRRATSRSRTRCPTWTPRSPRRTTERSAGRPRRRRATGPQRRWSRTSNASRRASPMKLSATTTRTMRHRPGRSPTSSRRRRSSRRWRAWSPSRSGVPGRRAR